ncbi:YqaJ viral recombinase family nuclease [Cupriavidus metallidurans]
MNITRETIKFSSEAAWLALRAKDVTSTEAAALFDVSPYTTEYKLHHTKLGKIIPDDISGVDRVKWGNRLESAIAMGIAEDHGIIVEPFKVYKRIPELRMGSSFDFQITGIVDGFAADTYARRMFLDHGPGIMEVKNVDGLQFRRTWTEDGEDIEAPPHIEFQVQHQLEVADVPWSMIAPLVGGNTPKVVIRQRDTEIGAMIRERVAHFWARVEAGVSPEPDFEKDAQTVKDLYVDANGSTLDVSAFPRVAELCRQYKDASGDSKRADQTKRSAVAEILTIIEGATAAIGIPGFKLSANTTKATFICQDKANGYVWKISGYPVKGGHVEYERKAFRNVRITETA